ncbi:hypothetical protein [Bailinhaonella thermotolerans]|uniref:hypothetical protein n=1 Tax=Bailinhaonella thermotolerans TaxID=1070861 RepID=UPI0011C4227A|nr:hypothetical protein [Bailinhaonella thermotolerans]
MSIPPGATVTIRLGSPTGRLRLTELRLRPPEVDEHAVELFTRHSCRLLACALQERTGWPLTILYPHHAPPGCTWRYHVGVRTPDGRFLDINGAADLADVERAWSAMYGVRVATHTVSVIEGLMAFLGGQTGDPAAWWRDDCGGHTLDMLDMYADALLARRLTLAPA